MLWWWLRSIMKMDKQKSHHHDRNTIYLLSSIPLVIGNLSWILIPMLWVFKLISWWKIFANHLDRINMIFIYYHEWNLKKDENLSSHSRSILDHIIPESDMKTLLITSQWTFRLLFIFFSIRISVMICFKIILNLPLKTWKQIQISSW